MVAKRSKIVIIGAGMAGLTAAQKLYTTAGAKEVFELCIVEGGERIGGRINTSDFMGDRIEMGATYIHGIGGSPVYELAQKIKSLQSDKPWECMDGLIEDKISSAQIRTEGGFVLNPCIVEPISSLFDKLLNLAKSKLEMGGNPVDDSIGSFLKHGLQHYQGTKDKLDDVDEVKVCGDCTRKMLEESVFSVYENIQRTYTGAGDLFNLDYASECEYQMFPGDEITIPRGYTTIIEALASVLPQGVIQLGRKVMKIEWEPNGYQCVGPENDGIKNGKPVKLHFSDGSIMQADHVIVTVSLGVLKAGIRHGSNLFTPSLPLMKQVAISRLGYGVVNKLFLQLDQKKGSLGKFPFMHLAFHRSDSEFINTNIPLWMRKTASLYPIYENSNVLLSWFAGNEALELETLDNEEIIDGVSKTISSFIPISNDNPHCHDISNVIKSKWGTDPLFLGSYSYVAVGSSIDDFDSLAKPLPEVETETINYHPLQILFAGEATHRTHYSTTHGAYFSGLREANRLLQHYKLIVEEDPKVIAKIV